MVPSGRLSELADYCKIHGHCNVPHAYSENIHLGKWVGHQRYDYKWHQEGKKSPITLLRIQALQSLGFEWSPNRDSHEAACEARLSELASYRKIYGHCNVPENYSENSKLGHWAATQKKNYKLHREGKKSPLTTLRIQALKSLGFE